MIILGIGGLIASGKSELSGMFLDRGYPVFDADAVVHDIYKDPETVEFISSKIGTRNVFVGGELDMKSLSRVAFQDIEVLNLLENFLHPKVRTKLRVFLHKNVYLRKQIVILDVPLLFESNISDICDYKILVKCSYNAQKYRYFKRDDVSGEKFNKILRLQQKNSFKERKSDFIVDTTLSRYRRNMSVRYILDKILKNERNSFRYRNYRFQSGRWRSGY